MLSLLVLRCQLANQVLEDPSAVFIAVKLIEAGTGRSQQHYIARTGGFAGALDRVLERPDAYDLSSSHLRLNLCRCRADGVHPLHSLFEQCIQHAVVAALVLATKNEVNAAGERLQRLNGRVHIGGFGIVVVLNATDRSHELQAMLYRFELRDRATDLCRLDSGQHSDTDCREHIFEIVRALQRNLLRRHDLAVAATVAPDYVPSAHERPARDFFQPAEPGHGRCRGRGHLDARLVVRMQNGEIVRALIFENTSLGRGVILKRIVPVKMIGGDIQHHRNSRMKALDGLQLEAANLQHHPSILGGTLDEGDCRRSDISTTQPLPPPSRNDSPRQRRGSGLAVGAADGDDLAFEEARSQFHLADNKNTQGTRLHQLRNIEGHARTDYDEVLIAEGALPVLSGFYADAVIEQ